MNKSILASLATIFLIGTVMLSHLMQQPGPQWFAAVLMGLFAALTIRLTMAAAGKDDR